MAGILAGWNRLGIAGYSRKSVLHAGFPTGRLDVAAVICSMYPAGTILLAGIILREHPTRRQVAGMGLALAAVALLSV